MLVLLVAVSSRILGAQRANVRDTTTQYVFGFHAGGFDDDVGGILSIGARANWRWLHAEALPLDIGMVAGSPNTAYSTDAKGNCHGPDGRFTSKSNCGGSVAFKYGAAGEVRISPDPRWPWQIGAGYRLGAAERGVYGTLMAPVTRETAGWFSVVARIGPKLYTIGALAAVPTSIGRR